MIQVANDSAVSAWTDGEILAVRTPPLPRRGGRNSIDFEPALYRALTEIDVPVIVNKLIWLLHIYPEHIAPHLVPDADNLEIKRIIDLISDATMGGDGGLTCSLRQDSYATNELPSGTFALVFPLQNVSPTRCEALTFAQKTVEKHP